jgi:hypothetical protein
METSEIVSTSIRKVKKAINPGLTPFFSPAIEFIGIIINHQSQLPNKVLIDPQRLVGSIQTELTENESMALSGGEIIGRVNFDFQLRR